MANAAGLTSIQTAINRRGFSGLKAYIEDYAALPSSDPATIERARASLCSLSELVAAEAKFGWKGVDLLLASTSMARLMNGAVTTSCKSAKDRTSMFQTLEGARFAQRSGVLSPE